jgi:hypothetical protein
MISQPPPPIDMPKGKRHKGLIIFGLILLVVGVLGGGAVAEKATSNYKDAVKSMARAPVGCTTTLVFDKPATFTVYAETKGKLGDLSGDCDANGKDYTHPGDKLPKIALTLVDAKGDSVDLARGATDTYDTDGYVGTAIRTVKITDAGTYRLNVESDDTDFAVSIGKTPKDDYDLLTIVGGGIVLGGVVLGLLFFLLGLRRRKPDMATADLRNASGPMPGWPPGPYAGTMPPAPPAPSAYPGYQPAPPPVQAPGQPPVRMPDQPGGGFAPPTFAPPPPAAPTGPTLPPTAPRYVEPSDGSDPTG